MENELNYFPRCDLCFMDLLSSPLLSSPLLSCPVLSSPLLSSPPQLDSRSFFFDIAPGAESGVSGFVTLLAAAHALRNATQEAQPNRTILYAFFQGVSSRHTIVFDDNMPNLMLYCRPYSCFFCILSWTV